MKRKLTTNQALWIYGLAMTAFLVLLNLSAVSKFVRHDLCDFVDFLGMSNADTVVEKLRDQREDYQAIADFLSGLELDAEPYRYYHIDAWREGTPKFVDSMPDDDPNVPQPDESVLLAMENIDEQGWCNHACRESFTRNTIQFSLNMPWYRESFWGRSYSLAYTIDGREPEFSEEDILNLTRIDAHWFYVESRSIY